MTRRPEARPKRDASFRPATLGGSSKVVIRLYATLRQRAGAREVEIACHDGTSVGDALRQLLEQRPALEGCIFDPEGRVVPYVSVFVDGRDIRHLDGLATPIDEDDEIAVFPPVAGG